MAPPFGFTAALEEPDLPIAAPAITRHHSETISLTYLADASVQLAEHVVSAVRPPQAVTIAPQALVTHYGVQYNGRTMGCGGVYSSDNPTIVAVSPARYAELPCGTQLQICGAGGCITGVRQDACPGCSANMFDLSESGFAAVCGFASGVCSATVSTVQTCESMDLSWADRPHPSWRGASEFAQRLAGQVSQTSLATTGAECAVR